MRPSPLVRAMEREDAFLETPPFVTEPLRRSHSLLRTALNKQRGNNRVDPPASSLRFNTKALIITMAVERNASRSRDNGAALWRFDGAVLLGFILFVPRGATRAKGLQFKHSNAPDRL